MKFDVNEYVKVKLTDVGRKEILRQHDELRAIVKSLAAYSEPIEDEGGYSKWQLWVLMSTFGHMMINGGELPFETEIIIVSRGANG